MTGVRWTCFLPAALLWLPAGVAAGMLARIFPLPVDAGQWWVPVAAMPCGLPLAGAWLALRRAGWKGTAWAVAAPLGALTAPVALAVSVSGPWSMACYSILLSLPAWSAYGALRRLDAASNRTRAFDPVDMQASQFDTTGRSPHAASFTRR
ncbi:MAG: hypothetical protein F4Y03_07015 [Alphaproteobacteria bacterium]|nr:hypothetical protein [Alphaproteobacteria bacterium]